MANATKITKRMYFNALKEYFEKGTAIPYATADVLAFIDKEVENLDKKSANRKPTKKQEENEEVKAVILDVLKGADKGLTVTEILATKQFADGTSNQKISALLKQMVDSKVVAKVTDKKVSRFTAVENA